MFKQKVILVLFFSILIFANSCDKEDDSSEDDPIEISEVRNDAGVVLNIPLSGSLQNPAFSPDCESIIFTRFVNGYNIEPAEVYKFNLTTDLI